MSGKVNKKNILVIFGGQSVESDVSIISGVQTLNNFDREKYEVLPVYIDKEGVWFFSNEFFNIETFVSQKYKKVGKEAFLLIDKYLYIKNGIKIKRFKKIDFVFFVTHGGNGENGSLQGYIEMCDLPYSSSCVEGSAIGMNKFLTKLILENLDIPTPKYQVLKNINSSTYADKKIKELLIDLNYPVVVKPCSLGSSIGISFCNSEKELKKAISLANLFDNEVVIEEAVQNPREVNVAVIGNRFKQEVSDIEEISKNEKIFTFEGKYIGEKNTRKDDTLGRKIPADLPTDVRDKIVSYAKSFFQNLNLKGIVRIDFLIDGTTNKVYFNEANTIPGSLASYLWESKKYSFSKLLDKIIDYAIEDKVFIDKKIKVFSSQILSRYKANDFLK